MDTRKSKSSFKQRIGNIHRKTIKELKADIRRQSSSSKLPNVEPSPPLSPKGSRANSPVKPVRMIGNVAKGGMGDIHLRVFTGTSEVKEFFKRFELAATANELDDA